MRANTDALGFQSLTWRPRHVTIRGSRHMTRMWSIGTHWKSRSRTKARPMIWSRTHSWSRAMHEGVGSSWRKWWTHSWVHHPRWWWPPERQDISLLIMLEIQRSLSLSTVSRYIGDLIIWPPMNHGKLTRCPE